VRKDKHLTITVDVEEWFHSNWFDAKRIIDKYYDGKTPQSDVVETIDTIISVFDALGVQATFFLLGGTSERYPSIIDMIKDAGHEVASHGYFHQINRLSIDVFRAHLQRFKKNVYAHPKGFRFPNYIFHADALNVLAEEGFLYDSSMVPSHNIPGWYGDPRAPREPHIQTLENHHDIVEFPISVSPLLRFPGAGGWFLRNAGFLWTYYVITAQMESTGYANFYFHNWEISNQNPRHPGIPFHVFRNTGASMLKRIQFLINAWKKIDAITFSPFEELLDSGIDKTC
jgi:peptidoglycan/xylan/chitin deacetylase (PgdA/CDA1 family)